MSSVLILALNQLNKIKTVDPKSEEQNKIDKQEESKNPDPVKLIIQEQKVSKEASDDDDFEDLAPLSMQRSLSTPTSLATKSGKQSKQKGAAE